MLMHVGEYMREYGGEYVHEGVGTVTVATAPERAKGYGCVVTLDALTYVHVGEVWVSMRVGCGRV